MKNVVGVALILLLISGCKTLDVNEIYMSKKVSFEPLELRPSVEPNFQRIDILRQQETSTAGDVTVVSDVPYASFGFDLGNGLFMDLNHNISFRIDTLLRILPYENFVLERFDNARKATPSSRYKFQDYTLTFENPKTGKTRTDYRIENFGDSIAYLDGDKLDFALAQTDAMTIQYTGRRSKNIIYKSSDTEYFIKHSRRNSDYYKLSPTEIQLGDDYTLRLSANGLKMELLRNSRRGYTLLYIFEKTPDKIYVYDLAFKGKVIHYSKDRIQIQYNQHLGEIYSVKK